MEMVEQRIAEFIHPYFKPREVNRIVGLSPDVLRDWRRRDILHPAFDRDARGFHLAVLAHLLLLKRLSDHGIGPKSVEAWSSKVAGDVFKHTLSDPSAWVSEEGYTAWKGYLAKHPGLAMSRYMVKLTSPRGCISANSLEEAFNSGRDGVVTIVDLEQLGADLREQASEKRSDFRWQTFEKKDD